MDRVLQFICVSDFVFLFLFCVYVETLEPEVKILSLAIKSPGRADIVLPITDNGNHKGLWFTLKEGSRYSLNFTFQVSNNIVSGLKYTNTVWKTGMKGKLSLSLSLSCTQTHGLYAKESGHVTLDLRNQCFSVLWILAPVDSSKEMLGTFSPQAEPYTYEMHEETTPSGIFARGSYSARSKVGSANVLFCLSLWFTLIIPNNLTEILYHETRT